MMASAASRSLSMMMHRCAQRHVALETIAATSSCGIPLASSQPSRAPPSCLAPPRAHQQVRTFGAPKRVKGKGVYIRKVKRNKNVPRNVRTFPPPPPVLNAVSREERVLESRENDLSAAAEMRRRMEEQEEALRFDFTGLKLDMSDRVRKLFDLTNGSQREVVRAQKQRGMRLFEKRVGDTGSSAVQIIALTTRIQQMQTHLGTHRKDHSGKRGVDAMYVRRRKLLDYLERKDFDSYRHVVKTLGLIR